MTHFSPSLRTLFLNYVDIFNRFGGDRVISLVFLPKLPVARTYILIEIDIEVLSACNCNSSQTDEDNDLIQDY